MNDRELSFLLSGRSESHLDHSLKIPVHKDIVEDFVALRTAALADGIEIEIASGFRSFASQLNIWNAKAEGRRTLLDSAGNPLEFAALSPEPLLHAILRWSSLPGMSRHHWGTELDVFDKRAINSAYQLQLVPAEYQAGGPFQRLTAWLDSNMSHFGFFRPYQTDRGGVAPELWHLSHSATALPLWNAHSVAQVREALAESRIALATTLGAHLDEIFLRYFRTVDQP